MDKQQVISAMESDVTKSLKAFNAAATELVNSSYIIVSGKISKLLQSIASSRPLCEFMARSTEGYNFADELKHRQFRDEYGKAYIDVPSDSDEQMKFAFCLLFAVDTGKLNMENLLHTFYANSDANTEWHDFCADIVIPFVKRVNAEFLQDKAAEIKFDESEYQAESSESENGDNGGDNIVNAANAFSANFIANESAASGLDESLLESLREVAGEIIGIIAQNIALTILEREELMLVCDAFVTAVGVNDIKSIRIMYISLRNTLSRSAVLGEVSEKLSDLSYLIAGLGIPTEE